MPRLMWLLLSVVVAISAAAVSMGESRNAVEAKSGFPFAPPVSVCTSMGGGDGSAPRLAVFTRASGTMIHMSNPAVHTTPTMPPLGV